MNSKSFHPGLSDPRPTFSDNPLLVVSSPFPIRSQPKPRSHKTPRATGSLTVPAKLLSESDSVSSLHPASSISTSSGSSSFMAETRSGGVGVGATPTPRGTTTERLRNEHTSSYVVSRSCSSASENISAYPLQVDADTKLLHIKKPADKKQSTEKSILPPQTPTTTAAADRHASYIPSPTTSLCASAGFPTPEPSPRGIKSILKTSRSVGTSSYIPTLGSKQVRFARSGVIIWQYSYERRDYTRVFVPDLLSKCSGGEDGPNIDCSPVDPFAKSAPLPRRYPKETLPYHLRPLSLRAPGSGMSYRSYLAKEEKYPCNSSSFGDSGSCWTSPRVAAVCGSQGGVVDVMCGTDGVFSRDGALLTKYGQAVQPIIKSVASMFGCYNNVGVTPRVPRNNHHNETPTPQPTAHKVATDGSMSSERSDIDQTSSREHDHDGPMRQRRGSDARWASLVNGVLMSSGSGSECDDKRNVHPLRPKSRVGYEAEREALLHARAIQERYVNSTSRCTSGTPYYDDDVFVRTRLLRVGLDTIEAVGVKNVALVGRIPTLHRRALYVAVRRLIDELI